MAIAAPPAGSTTIQTIGSAPDADAKAGSPAPETNTVTLRALGSFHEDGNMTGKLLSPGDTFSTDRDRAAQLRSNGLVEYVDEAHEKEIHGTVDAKKIGDRVSQRAAMGAMPDSVKTTPLKNRVLGEIPKE